MVYRFATQIPFTLRGSIPLPSASPLKRGTLDFLGYIKPLYKAGRGDQSNLEGFCSVFCGVENKPRSRLRIAIHGEAKGVFIANGDDLMNCMRRKTNDFSRLDNLLAHHLDFVRELRIVNAPPESMFFLALENRHYSPCTMIVDI